MVDRWGRAHSSVMVPAQDFSGESAASNDPPDPVQSGTLLLPIGHAQVVVALVSTFVVRASAVGADVISMFRVGARVVRADVVGARVVGMGLMQQISLFFKQSKGFCGEASRQVATQTPSRP